MASEPPEDPVIRKYLERYAEPEIRTLDQLLPATESFGHTVLIPAYDEGDGLLEPLESLPKAEQGATLVVVVLNASPEAPAAALKRNEETREAIAATYAPCRPTAPAEAPLALYRRGTDRLLLVDRSHASRRIPSHLGVGLARKIAADLALALYAKRQLRSPLFHCTDADALLPKDAFARVDALAAQQPLAAAIHPFWHEPMPDTPRLRRASALYECSLRYYVLGLRWAGSPYAFHTIGSTLVLEAQAYAKVRGFPCRSAAEDFYLLNKLAKTGPILTTGGPPIVLQGRASHRVPFGTGPRLAAMTADGIARPDLLTYHPEIFRCLGLLLESFDALAKEPADLIPTLRELAQPRGVEPTPLVDVVAELGLEAPLHGCLQRANSPNARLKHLHTFFDGLKTLKLVHGLRDRAYPSMALEEALCHAPFLPFSDPSQPLEELRRSLLELEARALPRAPL